MAESDAYANLVLPARISDARLNLVDAGLATPKREGREVRYEATPERLATALTWLLESSPQWDRRIERLRQRAQPGPGRLPATRRV